MASISWSNEVVLEFLDLYRNEQMIWDPNHPLNRKRKALKDAWIRIQTGMSVPVTVDQLKRKKECLMTVFRMYYRRKKQNPDYIVRWFPYSFMESFLDQVFSSDYTDYEYLEISPNDDSENLYENCIREPTPPGHQFKNLKIANSKFIVMPSAQKRIQDESIILVAASDLDQTLTDEYELYGRLLAKKLRKLDENQRDLAMHDIDMIMFRAKTKCQETSQMPSVSQNTQSPLFMSTDNHEAYGDESKTYDPDSFLDESKTYNPDCFLFTT